MCRFPEIIENKWPATLSFGKEFKRTIEFSKPINPSESGLIDVPCEGIIFYKCSKQLNLQPMKVFIYSFFHLTFFFIRFRKT